jgi:hypothetical protein
MPWIGPEAALMETAIMGTATDPGMGPTSRASTRCTVKFARSYRGTAASRGTETETEIEIEIEGTEIGIEIATEGTGIEGTETEIGTGKR